MKLPSQDLKSTNNSLWIEHHVQRIITKQEQAGVQFDKTRASFYVHTLRERQARLYEAIRPRLSLELSVPYDRPVSRPYLKDGTYNSAVTKWFGVEESQRVSGPFTRCEYVEPDLGKRGKITAQLLRLGWKPRAFTEKGSPKLTVEGSPCPSLDEIGDDVGRTLADWYIFRHRESQILGWLGKLRSDGRLPARAITIGTPTFRFRHSVVVNVPKAAPSVLFGRQMRSLFTVKKGYKMVGYDASGLELRMLADAINDELFTKEVIDGDIHSKNQADAGLPTRDNAKTFIYAFIYGAGDAKIGSIIGGSVQAGRRIKEAFLRSNPRLAACIEDTKNAGKRGWLLGLDGRKIRMRRDKVTKEIQIHKALNTRLQCAGAVVMKYAMVILDEWITQYGLDAQKVIDMHDEGQHEVLNEHAEFFAQIAPMSIVAAGVMLNLNVPLEGEAKIGNNWAQTH